MNEQASESTTRQQLAMPVKGHLPWTFRMILFCTVAVICRWSSGQQARTVSYGVNNGLPQDYVYTLDQDYMGFLWIGTGDGLARFDGKSITVYTTEDSLCGNFITSSLVGENNSWFGHSNGGVSRFNGRTFTKIVRGDLGTGSITDLKRSGAVIWASSQSGGIWRIPPGGETVLYTDEENKVPIFAFEMLSSTELAVGSMDGVYVYTIEQEAGRLRLITRLEGLPDTKIQDLYLDPEGIILFILTQDEGIYTYNTRQYTPVSNPLPTNMEEPIESPQQIFEDSRGNLWIPTFGNGLYKLEPDSSGMWNLQLHLGTGDGLTGDDLKVVFEDREENIWLGMYGSGLSRLVDEAFAFYRFEEEGLNNNVLSVYSTERYLWCGTQTGLIRRDRQTGKDLNFGDGRHGLPADKVTAIEGTGGGDLWIGTSQNGVFRLSPSSSLFRPVPISTGVLENAINGLEFQNPYLWIATGKGVCKLDMQTGSTSWFTISNAGLPHNTVYNILAEGEGRVWISTRSNRIIFIENDSVYGDVNLSGGSVLDIRTILREADGTLWAGTYGNGVFRAGRDALVNYGTDQGLISDYCYSLLDDGAGNIWIGHKGGMSKLRKADGHITAIKEEAGIGRAMEFNFNAAHKDHKGALWFGSSEGVLAYEPGLAGGLPPPPALSITSVLVNEEPVTLGKILELPPGRHNITIRYAGINLKNPEAVRYRYRMEGLGNSWSEASGEDHVQFNALADGKYTFLLDAANGEGITQEHPVRLAIVIAKPLWKRWWFYLLSIILVSSGVIFYIKRREYQLRMEKQVLEKAVRERTEEVVQQKEEIESQADRIRLINKNITDSITYARRIQRAVFPPAEQLTRLFPESFVFHRPQYIVSGDFFWLARANGRLVVTVADCTGHGVPGAFMSMLGITLLNEIVNTQECMEADGILNKLKHEIISALRQKGSTDTASDGMDMALCVYDPAASSLQFAGGFNPMILVRNGELKLYRGDPMPVGIGSYTGKKFTLHELKIRKGDQIYLYSDGFEDQFGGEKDKKYSRKRFRETVLEIHPLPMEQQRTELERRLDEWMGGRDQIDDITVMGIRL